MSLFIPTCSKCILIVVDVQPTFMRAIDGADRVVERARFLAQIAQMLEVPVFATIQNPARMGATDERIKPLLQLPEFEKMAFSCLGCPEFADAVQSSGRRQALLVGIETHICVSQTAHHLLEMGFDVAVAADAVGSRTQDRHQIGLDRMREAGAAIVHTESMAYEWLQTADHPRFREALQIVKGSS